MSPTLAVLPLSPDRACARYRSWTGRVPRRALVRFTDRGTSRLQDLDPHVRLDLAPIDQRGPVGDDLLDGRPPAGEAGDAWRPGQDQRGDFPSEPLDRSTLAGTDTDPQLDLRQIGRRRPAQASMRGIRTDELRKDLVVYEPEVREPLPEHTIRGPGFVVRLRPCVDERADCFVSPEVGHRHLEHRRPRTAANSAHAHPVAPGRPEPDGGEV